MNISRLRRRRSGCVVAFVPRHRAGRRDAMQALAGQADSGVSDARVLWRDVLAWPEARDLCHHVALHG